MDIREIARAKACLIAGIMTVGVAGAANFGVAGADADDAIIRVVQWNIGHFAMGRKNRTTIAPEKSAARSAEYRAEIARLKPDVRDTTRSCRCAS